MKRIKFLYSKSCRAQVKKSPLRIKKAFLDALSIYQKDPNSQILNKHNLEGKYKGCKSININHDWRAVFIENKNSIYFLAFGTHEELYG